jgi:shikimate kinase
MKTVIVLFGFKNVGKTTLGRKLACHFKVPFLDLDELLEKQFELSIRQIYNNLGETVFRIKELEELKKIDFTQKKILALGGGTLTHQDAFEFLKDKSHLILLETSYAQIKKRILEKNPLWSALDPKNLQGSLEILYEKRRSDYKTLNCPSFDLSLADSYLKIEDYVRQYIR